MFFDELGLPKPDVYLGVGSASHTRQTAAVMTKIESLFEKDRPDYVLVVGDVNSTLAVSLVAAKMRIRLGHVESGLRSFDRDMPEEINRMVTDVVADDLFTSCTDAAPNLEKEGVDPKRVHFVGNVMIDSLVQHRELAQRSTVLEREGLESRGYILVTLHPGLVMWMMLTCFPEFWGPWGFFLECSRLCSPFTLDLGPAFKNLD